ncbi:MAG TPA: DNA-formamidopyrimidine glycosylase family protein [Thermoanaerobaculia bacterium]|nr:DNA-formamidopyrimidine glycosylase family protein [Thermoanaerobaculia bacterium]
MPELPEVETYKRYFAKHALHQRIARVDVRDERILADIRKETFAGRLKGREFTETLRHGKHLFCRVTGQPGNRATAPAPTWLHLHFGMTGDLAYYRAPEPPPRFAKIVFEFDGGGRLAFEDMRLFGLANLVDDPDAFIRERGLGPDPLDLDSRAFARLLDKRRGAIKSLLMSQEIIAGLGNLYVDEILFQTNIHPRRPAGRLRDAETRALFTTMRRILRTAIERDLPPRSLFHHREEGERCPRCGGTLRRTVVFGRTTYFCPKHQR